MTNTQFKSGDRVRCISESKPYFGKLGKIYTVGVCTSKWPTSVFIEELGRKCFAYRFELVSVLRLRDLKCGDVFKFVHPNKLGSWFLDPPNSKTHPFIRVDIPNKQGQFFGLYLGNTSRCSYNNNNNNNYDNSVAFLLDQEVELVTPETIEISEKKEENKKIPLTFSNLEIGDLFYFDNNPDENYSLCDPQQYEEKFMVISGGSCVFVEGPDKGCVFNMINWGHKIVRKVGDEY